MHIHKNHFLFIILLQILIRQDLTGDYIHNFNIVSIVLIIIIHTSNTDFDTLVQNKLIFKNPEIKSIVATIDRNLSTFYDQKTEKKKQTYSLI